MIEKAQHLRELAEKFNLHGLYFQHVALCSRRAWLHLHGATHAIRNKRVRRGHALHQCERRPNNVPMGLGIFPDSIDFNRRVVTEKKGGKGAPNAVARQALFYAAYMTATTGKFWKSEVQVYGTRRHLEYELSEAILDELIGDAQYSVTLRNGAAPKAVRIPLCKSCSCNQLCWE